MAVLTVYYLEIRKALNWSKTKADAKLVFVIKQFQNDIRELVR